MRKTLVILAAVAFIALAAIALFRFDPVSAAALKYAPKPCCPPECGCGCIDGSPCKCTKAPELAPAPACGGCPCGCGSGVPCHCHKATEASKAGWVLPTEAECKAGHERAVIALEAFRNGPLVHDGDPTIWDNCNRFFPILGGENGRAIMAEWRRLKLVKDLWWAAWWVTWDNTIDSDRLMWAEHIEALLADGAEPEPLPAHYRTARFSLVRP